jgi:hypothetical protein
MFALWRMPSGIFNRYGQPPETGLDDWTSRGAYDWLTRNAGLFTNTASTTSPVSTRVTLSTSSTIAAGDSQSRND